MAEPISVSMLGSFSIIRGENQVDDSSNRMRKVWLLLAYLIYTRRTRSTQDQYLSLVQGSTSTEIEDPAGRLKALFYRVRAMLEPLGEKAGHELILHKSGSYTWNTQVALTLDVEEFERLYTAAAAAETGDARLQLLMQALEIYRGDFLPKLSTEAWVMPISAYYHQRYLEAASQALETLCSQSRYPEALEICRRALKIEPYSEALYQYQMRCQIASGDRSGAIATYEAMSELLFEAFGVMPSDESRTLYREASRESTEHTVPTEAVREQLQEPASSKGAVFCEYDFFKLLYQVQARSIIRSGDVIHIALLSLHSADDQALSRRSLDRAMENLQSLTVNSLRQGDVVTRCSASQLIVMLPQANYENSRVVCQRIVKAFYRQYPHSPAQIRFSVHPLEPTVPGNGNPKAD